MTGDQAEKVAAAALAAPSWCPQWTWDELLTRRAELERLRGGPLDRPLDYVLEKAIRLAVRATATGFDVCDFTPGHGGRQLVTATLVYDTERRLVGGSVLWSELIHGRCYALNPGLFWIPEDITERFGYDSPVDAVPLAELLTLTSARMVRR